LVTCLTQDQQTAAKLVEVTQKDNRLWPKFYRIGFYGSVLKDLEMDGKEFIYKRDSRVNLAVMQQYLKDVYSKKMGGTDNIVILPNKPVDNSKLENNKLYIQIASVKPFFHSSETGRDTTYDQTFNTSQFLFESAYTEGGKAQSETSRQQKKKEIFEVEQTFPYLKNRLTVVNRFEVILTPIENAIELVEDRVTKLRQELKTDPPRINALQQLLQGSVVPMVNEGPLRICEIFLTDPSRYPSEHVARLRKALKDFSLYCGFAMALNKRLLTEKHVEFHNMLEKHYDVMKTKIKGYVDVDS